MPWRHIAAMPRLKRLRIQESIATDEGFVALAKSQTLEGIWGRVCQNFGSRGFIAFSKMPALRSLGIGCKNVDDAALATLPEFPALRELTPIGFRDDGFRHIGRCRNLERLTCMYCRETGDAATEHIEGLAIKYYYAGLTQITDRSLEILGSMESLEQVDLYECLEGHGCRSSIPRPAAEPPRGPSRWIAWHHAGGNESVPAGRARLPLDVIADFREVRRVHRRRRAAGLLASALRPFSSHAIAPARIA